MRPPRLARSARAIVAAAVVTALAASCASSHPAAPPRPTGTYLALGDSLAFGYRPGGQRPTPDYHDPSTFVGYPEDVGAALGLSVVNASCPGETVASMIATSADSNGCENVDGKGTGYRSTFPLHVRYDGSQLAFAVQYLEHHRGRVGLITIDLGANDVDVCVAVADGCTTAEDHRSLENEIGGGLTTIYRSLRTTAGYRGPIVALTYYPDSFSNSSEVAVVSAVNGVVAGATRHFGGEVADGYDAFRMASISTDGDPCAAGLLVALPDGTCDEHPSIRGQRLLARALESTVQG